MLGRRGSRLTRIAGTDLRQVTGHQADDDYPALWQTETAPPEAEPYGEEERSLPLVVSTVSGT